MRGSTSTAVTAVRLPTGAFAVSDERSVGESAIEREREGGEREESEARER